MDLFEKLRQNPGAIGQFSAAAHETYMFPKFEGELGNRMSFNGKEMIMWSINNYLGMANMPEIREVDTQAIKDWGMAYPMGSRMMSGNTELHNQLERELADFVSKEAALLLNFGYQGIMSAIDALVSRNDIIVYDAESHACILDGVRLHMGRRLVFQHNDMESLDKRGDQGKLKEIIAMKDKYEFRLLVDDAHGFGTLGATGAGAGEEQGCQDGIDIYFSTFAKSMASIGAFIAADQDVVRYLQYNIRSQIFAKSLPMAQVVGARKRLELLRTRPEMKKKLWENVTMLQNGLKERGFNLGESNSCVTPVYLSGSPNEAMNLMEDLRANFGIFCSAVIYPVIPKGQLLLRLIPTSAHTKEDIEITLDAFSAISEKLNAGKYDVAVPTMAG